MARGVRAGLRLGAQDGSVAAEYVGFGAVIAAVVVVLFAFDPSLADRLRSPVDDQVCKVLRADCEGENLPADEVADRGGDATRVQADPPDSCTRESRKRSVKGSLKITFVEVGGGVGYLREERSDGEIHVTWIDEGQIGATAGIGARGGIELPSRDFKAGALASVEAHLGGELGNTRVFTEDGEADDYIGARRNHALRQAAGAVSPALGLLNAIKNGVSGGPDFGEPDLVYFEAKIGGSGLAGADLGPAGAKADAKGDVAAGAVRDRRTGETTLYIKADGDVGGEAGAILGGSGSKKGEVVLALTLDNDGNPVNVTTSRMVATGRGGLLGAPNLSLKSLDAVLSKAVLEGEATHTVAVTTELDLRDADNRQAALDLFHASAGLGIGIPGLRSQQEAADRYAQRLLADGKIGVTEHEGSTWGIGAGAEIALGAKLGLDLGYTSSDSRVTDASFLGVGPDGERVLVAWPACTG